MPDANEARLRDCPGPHEIRRAGPGLFRCQLCGGEIPAEQVELYLQGVRHGRTDLLRDFKSGRIKPASLVETAADPPPAERHASARD